MTSHTMKCLLLPGCRWLYVGPTSAGIVPPIFYETFRVLKEKTVAYEKSAAEKSNTNSK